MKSSRSVTGPRWLVVLFVLGSMVALGCGDSPPEDDDDDETGGSSATGGSGGVGGTTSGSGGSGGGSGTSNCSPERALSNVSCSAICARDAACPDAMANCVASCEMTTTEAAAMGCSSQYQATLGCLATCVDFCNLTQDDCLDALNIYVDCVIGYCLANPSAAVCV